MDNNDLGLPLEYQQMPEYFDAHNISVETDAKNAVIERLLKEQNIQTVLDMTCGTGSQVFYLHERGFDITGSDFSPNLIKQAKGKSEAQQKEITFINGDIRSVKVGEFDAVISIFNAIGHLIKPDFEQALQNIRANLKNSGIYIFDIFNLQAITDEVIADFAMDIDKTINGTRIHNVQHSEIDREQGLLTSHDEYVIYKEGQEPEKINNSFSLQIYTAQELKDILSRNGFELIEQYSMEGTKFIEGETLNILTVARKL